MYCQNCGTQIPDGANYCHKCGKAQKLELPTDDVQWETCEINVADTNKVNESMVGALLSPLISITYHFEANALGPNGSYIAGKSKSFKGHPHTPNQEKRQLFNFLVAELLQDGWEPVQSQASNPARWWEREFRRQAKKVRI
jgi:zinc-ribbon domain